MWCRARERACKLDETERTIACVKSAFAIAQFFLRDAKLRGRMRTRELDQLLTEHAKSAAGAERAARASRAAAHEIGVRRPRIKTYVRGVYSECFRHDLRKDRFMALA